MSLVPNPRCHNLYVCKLWWLKYDYFPHKSMGEISYLCRSSCRMKTTAVVFISLPGVKIMPLITDLCYHCYITKIKIQPRRPPIGHRQHLHLSLWLTELKWKTMITGIVHKSPLGQFISDFMFSVHFRCVSRHWSTDANSFAPHVKMVWAKCYTFGTKNI